MVNWRRGFLVVVCSVSLLIIPLPVRADDLQQQLNLYQQQVNQLNSQLSSQKQLTSAQTAKVLAMKQSIKTLNDSINRYQQTLDQQQKELQSLNDQQKQLEEQRQQHITELSKFLRNNYEDGLTPYLSVLFQATSLSDFIDRVNNIHAIINTYNKIQTDIKTLDQQISDKQSEVKQKSDAVIKNLASKQQTQQTLQLAMAKEQSALSQLTAQEKQTLSATQSAQSHVNTVQQLIQEQNLEAALAAAGMKAGINPGASSSGGGISSPVAISRGSGAGSGSIIGFAQQFLGLPYVWGGTTPSPGFDCSGYVQYVYQHFGISLNRTSEEQFNEGTPVSRSNLQPGDLVFFSTYAPGASHVGIYVGNNTMLDASSYGISYDDLTNGYWAPRYLGARRVIAN